MGGWLPIPLQLVSFAKRKALSLRAEITIRISQAHRRWEESYSSFSMTISFWAKKRNERILSCTGSTCYPPPPYTRLRHLYQPVFRRSAHLLRKNHVIQWKRTWEGGLGWERWHRSTMKEKNQIILPTDPGWLWFCFTSICDWFRKQLAPPSQPIRSQTATWSPAFSRVSSSFLVFYLNFFGFFPLFWFCNTVEIHFNAFCYSLVQHPLCAGIFVLLIQSLWR